MIVANIICRSCLDGRHWACDGYSPLGWCECADVCAMEAALFTGNIGPEWPPGAANT